MNKISPAESPGDSYVDLQSAPEDSNEVLVTNVLHVLLLTFENHFDLGMFSRLNSLVNLAASFVFISA